MKLVAAAAKLVGAWGLAARVGLVGAIGSWESAPLLIRAFVLRGALFENYVLNSVLLLISAHAGMNGYAFQSALVLSAI